MCRIKNESHKYYREQNPFLYVVWIKEIWGYKKKLVVMIQKVQWFTFFLLSHNISNQNVFQPAAVHPIYYNCETYQSTSHARHTFSELELCLISAKIVSFTVYLFILSCIVLLSLKKKKRLWGTCSKRAL